MRLRTVTNLLVVGGLHVAFFAYGCSSSSTPMATTDGGVTDSGGGGTETSGPIADPDCPATVDSSHPPAECGPNGIDACSKLGQDTLTCSNTSSACLAPVAQTGTVASLRMSTIRLYEPTVLQSAASLAVNPAIQPACIANSSGTAGEESFNWLLQIDTVKNTLRTGGALYASDHQTYAFLDGKTVSGSDISMVCPGFDAGPATSTISLGSITAPLTLTNGKYASATVPLLNVPIYPSATSTIPIVLPLTNAMIYDMELSSDHTCIGSFLEQYSCDGDTLGWKPGGGIVGQMLLSDADHVPVQALGCQSLCALLAGGGVKAADGYQHCPTNPDGTYPTTIGDSCVKGTGNCNDAITLTATFAAYGVTINN